MPFQISKLRVSSFSKPNQCCPFLHSLVLIDFRVFLILLHLHFRFLFYLNLAQEVCIHKLSLLSQPLQVGSPFMMSCHFDNLTQFMHLRGHFSPAVLVQGTALHFSQLCPITHIKLKFIVSNFSSYII